MPDRVRLLAGGKSETGHLRGFDTADFHVEAIDLLQNRVACVSAII
jgi:hypothetical protein